MQVCLSAIAAFVVGFFLPMFIFSNIGIENVWVTTIINLVLTFGCLGLILFLVAKSLGDTVGSGSAQVGILVMSLFLAWVMFPIGVLVHAVISWSYLLTSLITLGVAILIPVLFIISSIVFSKRPDREKYEEPFDLEE